MLDTSKLCADHLRAHLSVLSINLKASHARELVAAFFGYKTHAAQKAEALYPLNDIEQASFLVPDTALMDVRRTQLASTDPNLPSSHILAQEIVGFLIRRGYFSGKAVLGEPLETYVLETVVPEAEAEIYDDLSGVMTETNAYFDEIYAEEAEAFKSDEGVSVVVSGQAIGRSDPDRPFCGDKIDMEIRIDFPRVAGYVAFGSPDIVARGEVNDDWVDPELKYGTTS